MDAAEVAARVSAPVTAPAWVVLAPAALGLVIPLAQVLEFSTVAVLASGQVHRLELDTARLERS